MSALTDILQAHSRRVDFNHPGYGKCRCGFDPEGWTEDGSEEGIDNPSHAEHVAEAVAAAGLFVASVPMQNMTKDIAVVCSDKLYRIRQLVEREPTTSLAARIRAILDDSRPAVVVGQPTEQPEQK